MELKWREIAVCSGCVKQQQETMYQQHMQRTLNGDWPDGVDIADGNRRQASLRMADWQGTVSHVVVQTVVGGVHESQQRQNDDRRPYRPGMAFIHTLITIHKPYQILRIE